jgi:hypothetical protein
MLLHFSDNSLGNSVFNQFAASGFFSHLSMSLNAMQLITLKVLTESSSLSTSLFVSSFEEMYWLENFPVGLVISDVCHIPRFPSAF